MLEYFEHAATASIFLRDLVAHWYVWWPVGIVIFVIMVRCCRDEFCDAFSGTVAGAVMGSVLGFIWPGIVVTAPFWLPILLVMVIAVVAACIVNKVWSR